MLLSDKAIKAIKVTKKHALITEITCYFLSKTYL